MSSQTQKEDWRKVMVTQYSIFGTIAGLEVTALTIFAAFGDGSGATPIEWKVLFTITVALLFFEVVGILWMINQERKVAFGVPMQCFRENESFYRSVLILIMILTWGFILTLLIMKVWGAGNERVISTPLTFFVANDSINPSPNLSLGVLPKMGPIAIAAAAIATAIFTGLTVCEMRKSRQRLEKPNIQISLEPQARWGNFFDLVIENLGEVPVYNLQLELEPKGVIGIGDRKIDDINLFKTKMPVFGVNRKMRTFIISYPDYLTKKQPNTISFTAKYKTASGRKVEQKYTFNMGVYEGMTASSEKSLKDVTKVLEKIERKLGGIERSLTFDRLKTKMPNPVSEGRG